MHQHLVSPGSKLSVDLNKMNEHYSARAPWILMLNKSMIMPSKGTLRRFHQKTCSNQWKPQTYYLPMHGVSKLSSSTTKLRVVCDASAKTAGGPSLNDTLIPGPSLYPRLTTVLQKFRLYDVVYSADISRMFREVALHPDDKYIVV